MTLKFYNTLSRKLEEFKEIETGVVSLYCCGPTVYNYVHIGNLRAYTFNDLLRRYLKYKGFQVKHVMNITDVDDKTIRDSQKAGKSLKEFTEYYTETFLEDLKTLNIEIPEELPRATNEIDGMVAMVKTLLDKGFAYKSEKGDVYFKISAYEHYGKLVNLDTSSLKKNAAGRLSTQDEYEKEDARDFVLWKSYVPEDGDVFWETELGKGRPGWHIECSVMSSKYLGQPFDIHAGGVDLTFPHHTNEIAQSECAYGKKFVNYWLHNDYLIVNGKKMSKSLGNFYTLRDLLEKGIDPMAIRYELLKTHYRQRLDFKEDNMKQNLQAIDKFHDFFERLEHVSAPSSWPDLDKAITQASSAFEESLDNDLNISGGLAAIFEFMNTINREADKLSPQDSQKVKSTMQNFNSVLGLNLEKKEEALDSEIEALIQAREEARKNKDFAKSDALRDQLQALGIELKDTPQGPKWKKA